MVLRKEFEKIKFTVISVVVAFGTIFIEQGCSIDLISTLNRTSNLSRASIESEVEEAIKENPPELPKLESKNGFSTKAMSLVSEGLQGNLFNNKEESFGWGSPIQASNFKKGTEYFWHFSSDKIIVLAVWKYRNNSWVYDGLRYPNNNYTFLKAGFKDPDFQGVYILPYSFSNNNRVTSALMTVHGVKDGSFISQDESKRIYGDAGTNTETYDIPVTLKYAGKDVSRLTCNKKAYPKLASFLATLKSSGILAKNNSYSGAYNYRFIGTSSVLSNHSWGAAIDLFTADSSGKSLTYADTGKFVNDNPIIKELAQKHDFSWGGYWAGKSYDPMHFELVNPNF